MILIIKSSTSVLLSSTDVLLLPLFKRFPYTAFSPVPIPFFSESFTAFWQVLLPLASKCQGQSKGQSKGQCHQP